MSRDEMKTHVENLSQVAESVIEHAKSLGATDADAVGGRSTDFEVKVADGKIITLTQAVSKSVAVRIFVDGRQGTASTSDFTPDNLRAVVERAVAMAREAAVDEFNGLADAQPGRFETGPEYELYDPAVVELSTEQKIAWAHELEAAARSVDPRVKKFRDSGVSSGAACSVLATSRGVFRSKVSTGISLWSIPIAEEDGQLQTENWYDVQTHLEDLQPVEEIGKTAGHRAARMLGAKPIKTCRVPVIFEPQHAIGLFGGLVAAIDGDMVYKKTSFVADKLGEQIASDKITLVDDPHRKRGSATAAYDGEGLPTFRKELLDRGKLTTFLYDSYTARKAKAKPTASARRGGASPYTGTFNTCIEAGTDDPAEIYASCKQAFVFTRGLGSGVNPVTGEYSRGANGLWIENGEVVHPVQEVTIAGDFLQMASAIDRVGNDLLVRGSSGGPTLRIAEMAVSGT